MTRTDFMMDVSKTKLLSLIDMDRAQFPVYDMTGPKVGRKSIGKMTVKEFLDKFG